MNIEDDFLLVTGNAFSEMRLMVEGAITLFEEDAGILCRLAINAEEREAHSALNDIGTALYDFRQQIKMLQEAHYKETKRLSESHA